MCAFKKTRRHAVHFGGGAIERIDAVVRFFGLRFTAARQSFVAESDEFSGSRGSFEC